MSQSREKNNNNHRKLYLKPQVEIVQLLPKQTVLGGCLSSSLSGPADTGCTASGGLEPCY